MQASPGWAQHRGYTGWGEVVWARRVGERGSLLAVMVGVGWGPLAVRVGLGEAG